MGDVLDGSVPADLHPSPLQHGPALWRFAEDLLTHFSCNRYLVLVSLFRRTVFKASFQKKHERWRRNAARAHILWKRKLPPDVDLRLSELPVTPSVCTFHTETPAS
jgi:hypothetical protein